MKELNISNYFSKKNNNYSARDWKYVEDIRNHIDSYEDEADIYKYLYERRQSSFNRAEDKRLFGIPEDCEVNINFPHNKNKYYNPYLQQKREKEQVGKKLDYYKRDRNGNLKYDRNGVAKQKGNVGRKMTNFANNMMNSKIGKTVKFIATHFHAILITLVIILGIIIITIAATYIIGMINSMGESPFVQCTSSQIKKANKGETNNTIFTDKLQNAQIAKPEVGINYFISYALQANWKKEAIIGSVSYILLEGSGLGTFTYEMYFSNDMKGPGGHSNDIDTLDNQKWLDWIDNEGRIQARSIYYKEAHENGDAAYCALGIGLIQLSDVWSDDSTKTATNASDYIKYCIDKKSPWQDPQTQCEYYFNVYFPSHQTFDTSDCTPDPTKDDRTSEEWCRRFTTGIGMPGYAWNDNYEYIDEHVAKLSEAEALVNNFNSSDISSLTGIKLNENKNYCKGATDTITGNANNSTIADAAVSITGSDGTKIMYNDNPNIDDLPTLSLYKQMNDKYIGDKIYASCDRTVCTAIRWSGADPNFEEGPVSKQYTYLNTSSNWEKVGVINDTNFNFEPGDVIITDGHILMYVGNEAVKKKYPNSSSNTVEASGYVYYPYCNSSPYRIGSEVYRFVGTYSSTNNNNNNNNNSNTNNTENK